MLTALARGSYVRPSIGRKPVLDPLPEILRDDRLVLTRVRGSLVHRHAEICSILQYRIQRPAAKSTTAACDSRLTHPRLAAYAAVIQIGSEPPHAAKHGITLEYRPDLLRLGVVDHQPAVADVVADGRRAAH